MDLQSQPQENRDESKDLVAEASAIKVIKDPETYKAAAKLRGEIKFAIDYHCARLDPLVAESNAHTANLRKERASHVEPLQMTFKYLGEMITDYNDEQDRIRKERQLIEEARVKKEAIEAKQRMVDLAKDIGDKQLINQMKQAPINIQPVVVVIETPIVEDLSFASHKHYEVVDLLALVKAVASGAAPIRVLWDIAKPFRSAYLNTQATALHDTIKPDANGIRWLYPGVKVWSTKTAVTKSS